MYCLKCGRDTKSEQVFCEACVDGMAQYPVKPGTPVNLPRRAPQPPRRPVRRQRILSVEEQLAGVRRTNRKQKWWITVLLILVIVLSTVLVHQMMKPADTDVVGRNYTIGRSK